MSFLGATKDIRSASNSLFATHMPLFTVALMHVSTFAVLGLWTTFWPLVWCAVPASLFAMVAAGLIGTSPPNAVRETIVYRSGTIKMMAWATVILTVTSLLAACVLGGMMVQQATVWDAGKDTALNCDHDESKNEFATGPNGEMEVNSMRCQDDDDCTGARWCNAGENWCTGNVAICDKHPAIPNPFAQSPPPPSPPNNPPPLIPSSAAEVVVPPAAEIVAPLAPPPPPYPPNPRPPPPPNPPTPSPTPPLGGEFLTAAAVSDNPFYSELEARAAWRKLPHAPFTAGYKDDTTLPATMMRSRGLVLLLAVLPLSLPLCLVAVRVAILAKKVHGLGAKEAEASGDQVSLSIKGAHQIMKPRKSLEHQKLILEASTQLMRHFKPKPDPKYISRSASSIEDLIAREYLERDANNPNLYKYLA